MVHMRRIFNKRALSAAIAANDIRATNHPDLPLVVLNYTEQAQFARHWNPVTEQCRGLIVDTRTGRIVARPFRKFWNHNEPESASAIAQTSPVTVTSKEDGSLGILYPVPARGWLRGRLLQRDSGEFRFATRGAFLSEQAVHATRVWRLRYAHRWTPPKGYTALFEVVYPNNRLVLDYGRMDDLILLGFVHNRTGRSFGPDSDLAESWPGPRARVLPYRSFAAALADEPQDDVEGYVVHFLDTDQRVKTKGAWYLQMHRLVTGLSARVLWEHLAINACARHFDDPKHLVKWFRMGPDRVKRVQDAGEYWYHAFITGAPDELRAWIEHTVDQLRAEVGAMRFDIHTDFERLADEANGDRREFAALVGKHPHSGALFSLWDEQQIDSYLWRAVRPPHELPYREPEEVAA